MTTLEEIDQFIEQKKAELEELELQEQIIRKRMGALDIKKTPELERKAFDMLSYDEQELLRSSYQNEHAATTTSGISARVVHGRCRSRIMV